MRAYHYRYPVRLSQEHRLWLETIRRTSRTPAKHYLVARVLLMSDQSQGTPEATDGQIAEMLSISRRIVIRIKQRFVQGSLEVALTGSFPRERPERRCLDGKGRTPIFGYIRVFFFSRVLLSCLINSTPNMAAFVPLWDFTQYCLFVDRRQIISTLKNSVYFHPISA